jgi:cytochrome c biogenesis protein CcmG/thiol:disulfide interchange protein DsbE
MMVGVNTLGDSPGAARLFLERYAITYPTGQDARGAIAVEFGLTGVPEKFFIDRQGQLIRKYIGPMPEAALVAALEELARR